MIGNDIVDLDAAAEYSRIWRRGFLDKLFHKEEKEIIYASKNPEIEIWGLWAMKEATYKAHQRRFKLPRTYQPKSFSCKLENCDFASGIGEVRIGDFIYTTKNRIGNSYIHCTATGLEKPEIVTEIHSTAFKTRERLLTKVSALKNISIAQLTVTKDNAYIPHLYYKNTNLNIAFSLSHHGNFSAFTLALMKY